MRIVRFLSQGKKRHGVIDGDLVKGLQGNPFYQFKGSNTNYVFDGSTYSSGEVMLKPPCLPSKIVCLGLNYRSHAEETKLPIPEVPLIFMKPSTAVIGPGDAIILPQGTKRTDYEGELGIVIGRKAKSVPEEKVSEYILGYTCVNDVSERYNQRDDGQWTRAKGYDTFAPIGPCIETDIIPDDLKIETYLNGDLYQSSRTSDLIFGISRIVNFISGVMTLLPGDVIATGTPSGIGRINDGDTIEISIEGIGILRNVVVNEN